jgi:hypothetical protein
VEYFKYLGSILTNDGRCTCEIKSSNAIAKPAFNKKRALYKQNGLGMRKKVVKCYVWSITIYDFESWTLRAVDMKHLEGLKCAA